MLFDLFSDLHVDAHQHGSPALDYATLKNPTSRLAVVAGDTSNSPFESLREIVKIAEQYEHVVYVDGNHEHYTTMMSNRTVKTTCDIFRTDLRYVRENLHYLDGNHELFLDGTLFVGINGWYDWRLSPDHTTEAQESAWAMGMADARWIAFDHPPRVLALLQADLLRHQVQAAQARQDVEHIVVVTHTSPILKGLMIRPEDDFWNALNGSFGNSLMQTVIDADIKKKISVWSYGHTHFSNDFYDGHIRFVANARGYPNEKEWFGPVQLDSSQHGAGSAFGEIETN